MKVIQLTRGKVALVDDKDYFWLNWYKWSYLCSNGYARRGDVKGGRPVTVYMHREIMGAGAGLYVDHINGDKLDNRKENLRICTPLESGKNIGLKKNNRTGYIGVFKVSHHKSKPYMAGIVTNKKRKHLGYFKTPEEAAAVRDAAAKQFHGEFARLNFK